MAMMILNTFSNGNDFNNNEDIYQYDTMPETLKEQIIHIYKNLTFKSINNPYINDRESNVFWKIVNDKLSFEYGLPYLWFEYNYTSFDEFVTFFREGDLIIDRCLDLVKVPFMYLLNDYFMNNLHIQYEDIIYYIKVVNDKFREHSLGYELIIYKVDENKTQCQIVRVDNKEIHKNIVLSSLQLIQESGFEQANKEYMDAFEKYKQGDYKDTLVAAERTFESCMKVICDKLGYTYQQKDTAGILINILKNNQFIPEYSDDNFKNTLGMLKTSIPLLRNSLSGHGAGTQQIEVDRITAEYGLNMTATNIVYLIELYKNKLGV